MKGEEEVLLNDSVRIKFGVRGYMNERDIRLAQET